MFVQPKATRKYLKPVYDFVVKYKQEHDGIAPSLREIGAHIDMVSTSVVNYILVYLERLGLVKLMKNENGIGIPRGIIVTGGSWTLEESKEMRIKKEELE